MLNGQNSLLCAILGGGVQHLRASSGISAAIAFPASTAWFRCSASEGLLENIGAHQLIEARARG